MGNIYIIKNTVNNKVYIGQTRYSIQERFKDHIKNSRYFDNHLYLAMRKYGIDAFYIEPLEENVEDEKLNEREIFWIEKFDSYNKGYNMTIGGEGNKKYDYQKILEEWNNGKTVGQIKEIFGLSDSGVIKILNGLNIPHKERLKRNGELKQNCNSEYFLELWNKGYGLNQIAKLAGSTKETIKKRLFDFNITREEIDIRGKHLRGKPVVQKDLEGNVLNIFPTAAEAGRYLGLNRCSHISSCCMGKYKTAYGYKWEYYKKEENYNGTYKNPKENN